MGLRDGADTSEFNADKASDFIGKRAYQLSEMHGREFGHELEDRLQAKREIMARLGV